MIWTGELPALERPNSFLEPTTVENKTDHRGEQDQDAIMRWRPRLYRVHPNRVSRDFEGYGHRSVVPQLSLRLSRQCVDFSSTSGGVCGKITALPIGLSDASLANGGLYAIRDTVDQQYHLLKNSALLPQDKAVRRAIT